MEIVTFIAGYFTGVFDAIAHFAQTPFAEQPAAWIAVWAASVGAGLLLGWSVATDA